MLRPPRDPADDRTYRDRNVFGTDDTVEPLNAQNQALKVKELFR